MKLQIDTNAMLALFPEGSEARVELQNAVIANFARKMQDKYIDSGVQQVVRETINFVGTEQQIGAKIREELDKEFTKSRDGWYNTIYKLDDKKKIAKAIEEYASNQASTVRIAMEKDAKSVIDRQLEYSKSRVLRAVEEVIGKAEADMVRRVEQRISAKMDEIIRMEFAKLMSQGSFLSMGASVQPTTGIN